MGERFGDYELIRKIAAGGMAEIFLARLSTSDGFGRPVVVKRMLPQLAVRDDFVTMFLDEARLAANLTHPNIVQVFNLGEHAGAYFMAMELIDGPHLGALFAHSLRQRNALPIEYCAFAVARSADGLDYAHDRNDPATGLPLNIVHRDISPQNILVSKQGDVKVTDFGVAKAETQESKTRTGIIKGKVSYMSPEQCLGDKVDRQTDVFALGIVLYELLTRRRLFRDKSDMLVMQRITNQDVPAPSTVNAKIDDELDGICQKALARDKAARYQSAAELSEALDIWLVAKGYTSVKTGLARWMGEHAAELGLQVDGELSDPGSRPSWMDMQVEDTPHPGTPQDGTASTPALQAVVTASGLPQRKIGTDDSSEATLVADEPTIIDPSLSPLLDLTDQERSVDVTSTESDAKAGPLSGVHRHAPAPAVDPEERQRPMAALLGGGVALVIAVLVGVFVLGGGGEHDPVVVDPPDPTAEVDPGRRATATTSSPPPTIPPRSRTTWPPTRLAPSKRTPTPRPTAPGSR
jgi:serine/threonine protein kinase